MRASITEAHGHLLEWLLADNRDDEDDEPLLDMPYEPPNEGGAFERENTLEDRRTKRDRYARSPGSVPHGDVQTFVQRSMLGARVEQEFRRLISTETRRRAESGSRVDVRAAIRRLAGDASVTEVYERVETDATGDRGVGVALDMSSSMRGSELQAKAAVAAFAKAVEAVGDQLVATGFSSRSARLITGPEERFQCWHLDTVQASGGTPTAAGVDDVLNLLSATHASEQLLIVVTDGKPTKMLNSDQYSDAVNEVAAMVDRARERGVDVIGVGIGEFSERSMAAMFGEGAFTSTVASLEDDLVAAYESQTVA